MQRAREPRAIKLKMNGFVFCSRILGEIASVSISNPLQNRYCNISPVYEDLRVSLNDLCHSAMGILKVREGKQETQQLGKATFLQCSIRMQRKGDIQGSFGRGSSFLVVS